MLRISVCSAAAQYAQIEVFVAANILQPCEPETMSPIMSAQNDKISPDSPYVDMPTGDPSLPEGWLEVVSMDMEAKGIARKPDGKVVFIDGALPTELVTANVHRKKNNWEAASLFAIHRESSQRVTPGCPHAGLHEGACGGCKMQHLHINAQVAVKQRVLEDNLWHLGKVKAETMMRPIEGPTWGYRYRARLSVRYVIKKGKVLVGFHERKSRYIADMETCKVLPPHIDAMLMPMRALVASMDAREQLPQIEVACGDHVTALLLRHMVPLTEADQQRLRDFAAVHNVQWWLQPKGPETVHKMQEGGPELSYSLPDFGIHMPFKPTDFTQVNPHINRVLVTRALRLLDVQKHERVIDSAQAADIEVGGRHVLNFCANNYLGLGGDDRVVVVTRELTKLYEEVVRGPLGTIDIGGPRGEYVLVLDGAPIDDRPITDEDVRNALRDEIAAGSSTRDAAAVVAKDVGRPKREVYALALGLNSEPGKVPS